VTDLIRSDDNPWKIAEAYKVKHGRQALVAALKTWIDETVRKPYPIHHAIAALPLEAIITTAYDDRLEQALRTAGKSPVTVVTRWMYPSWAPTRCWCSNSLAMPNSPTR
jgi:hypothetical protein